MPALKIAVGELVIVALGSALIVTSYAWAHHHGYRSYSILVLGLTFVAVASVWAVRRATTKLGLRRWLGLAVTACCAVLATFVTLELSLVVLLNAYGS
jgi:hypothetical protein